MKCCQTLLFENKWQTKAFVNRDTTVNQVLRCLRLCIPAPKHQLTQPSVSVCPRGLTQPWAQQKGSTSCPPGLLPLPCPTGAVLSKPVRMGLPDWEFSQSSKPLSCASFPGARDHAPQPPPQPKTDAAALFFVSNLV